MRIEAAIHTESHASSGLAEHIRNWVRYDHAAAEDQRDLEVRRMCDSVRLSYASFWRGFRRIEEVLDHANVPLAENLMSFSEGRGLDLLTTLSRTLTASAAR